MSRARWQAGSLQLAKVGPCAITLLHFTSDYMTVRLRPRGDSSDALMEGRGRYALWTKVVPYPTGRY